MAGAHDPEEILDVVDENDNVRGSGTRKEVHEKGLLHREIYLDIINSKNEILLQKRSDTKKWDHAVGGHVHSGLSYEEAALREAKEELGIELSKEDLIFVCKEIITVSSHQGDNKRFGKLFLVKKDIDVSGLDIQEEELDDAKFFSVDEIKDMIRTPDTMTRSSAYFLEKYVLPYAERS